MASNMHRHRKLHQNEMNSRQMVEDRYRAFCIRKIMVFDEKVRDDVLHRKLHIRIINWLPDCRECVHYLHRNYFMQIYCVLHFFSAFLLSFLAKFHNNWLLLPLDCVNKKNYFVCSFDARVQCRRWKSSIIIIIAPYVCVSIVLFSRTHTWLPRLLTAWRSFERRKKNHFTFHRTIVVQAHCFACF